MSADTSSQRGIAFAELRLAAEGHRLTSTRRAVVAAVQDEGRPLTAEEICDLLPTVGRATVFRTVKLLQELDVLCRVPLEDGSVRYLASTGDHHHHLVCSECGTVAEFDSRAIDSDIDRQARAAGFQLESHAVELYGVCSNCR